MTSITRALLSTIAIACIGIGAQAQTVLKYSNWLPVGQALRVEVVEPWIAEVEKVTAGRIKIETMPKVVGTVPAQFDVARDGQADIVIWVNGYTPGRFDISEVIELPFMSDNAELFAPVADRFYRKQLAQYGEYKGVFPLSVFVVGTGQFFTSKRQVKTMADLKGLKLRSPQAGVTQSLTLLGAVPVSKPISEVYELLAGGVLDGVMLVPESVASFKLLENLSYATVVPGALYNTVLTLGMNEDKWKSLRKDDQDAIMKISGDVFSRKVGRAYMKGDEATWNTMRSTNKPIETASPAFVAEMKQALKPVEATWIEKARKKGVADPQKLIDALRAEVAAATTAK